MGPGDKQGKTRLGRGTVGIDKILITLTTPEETTRPFAGMKKGTKRKNQIGEGD